MPLTYKRESKGKKGFAVERETERKDDNETERKYYSETQGTQSRDI